VTDAVGFTYKYNPETDSISHPTGLIVLSPSGKTSQYIFGEGKEFATSVDYSPKFMSIALDRAREDAVGEKIEQPIFFGCFSHDPGTNKVTANVDRLLIFSGCSFVVLMATMITYLSLKYRVQPRNKSIKELHA